jgi:hypothetical protein
VGATPEDVAEYLRRQQIGETAGGTIGGLAGAGLGALGGMAGGQYLAGGRQGLPGLIIPAVTTGLGTLGGAALGARLGQAAGTGLGTLAAERGPAAQVTMPHLTPKRTEDIARRLALLAAARGARTPTVAISPT